MDLTFHTPEGVFNYRVCAVILHGNRLLAMKNQRKSHFFLPGGRVMLHESAQDAIVRELKEELGIHVTNLRPLWLNQGFFTENVTKQRFHELCIYYLVDISHTDLIHKPESFTLQEGARTNHFFWLPLETPQEQYLYPLFIKEKIHNLPRSLTMLTEYE